MFTITKHGIKIWILYNNFVMNMREMHKLPKLLSMKFGLENGVWLLMSVRIGLELSMTLTQTRSLSASGLTVLKPTYLTQLPKISTEQQIFLGHLALATKSKHAFKTANVQKIQAISAMMMFEK